MVHNGTDIAYDGTPDYGGTVLEFPTDLTDYAGLNSVPPHSARLAILTGVDGGAARALTQDGGVDGDIWMVQLATYTISNVPALSALTDVRDFVDAETQRFFVPAVGGAYDDTPPVELVFTPTSPVFGIQDIGLHLPINELSSVVGFFSIPTNYISDMIATALVKADTISGNVYVQNGVTYGECGESFTQHSDGAGFSAIAVDTTRNCIDPVTLTVPTIADDVTLGFSRDGNNVGDTLATPLLVYGWIVEYFGWKR